MRIRIVLLALAALAAAPAAAVHAQAPAGEAATEAAAASSAGAPVSQPAAPAADAPVSGASSLPRYTPPRTMRAYAHVFAAFAAAWLLMLGYVVSLSRKFRRVEEQLAALARS